MQAAAGHFEKSAKLRVLYAEDQASARLVTTALLRKLGYEVEAVEDGELALSRAQSAAYDLILLDIEMPVMDGATAAQRIRAEAGPCQHAPMMALSAFLADSTEACGWRGHFDHALPKPATASELKAAISLLIEKKPVTVAEPVLSFKASLPFSMWQRLAADAADEMRVLGLTIMACADAEDWDVLERSIRALKCLARNFDAASVVRFADGFDARVVGDRGVLTRHIAAWQAEALAA